MSAILVLRSRIAPSDLRRLLDEGSRPADLWGADDHPLAFALLGEGEAV